MAQKTLDCFLLMAIFRTYNWLLKNGKISRLDYNMSIGKFNFCFIAELPDQNKDSYELYETLGTLEGR